ncbi:MAG: ATP-binding protein [Lachnospiraceae bacterium]|nr:ATP-binding protein [Lachnospiraceae bacterium]
MVIKRKLYSELLEWKNNRKGKTAILIKGARRTGKSYLCEQFAKNEYKSYVIIDFANISNEIRTLFEGDTSDIDKFLSELQILTHTTFYDRETVIIFDEVQMFPKARQLIKYLVANNKYDYIETGSLLSIRKNVKDIVIPSEEEDKYLYPLDFEEFLWALGDEVTYPYIKECFEKRKEVGEKIHRKIIRTFREYLIVGGMPQSVIEYVESKNFESVDRIKRNILKLYRDDISKFASGYEQKVLSVFDEIPGQLSKKEKTYNVSSLKKEARNRDYEDAFMWLSDAMIVNRCLNATDPNVGLNLSLDSKLQKIYMGDTGLLVTHTFYDSAFNDNEFYKKILFDRLNFNEGIIMENIVAEALRYSGHRLFFYTRYDEERIEIDFLIKRKNKISPVEVKSSKYGKHTSLSKFIDKFSDRIGEKFILYPKDVLIKDDVTHLPLYMAWLL